VPVSPGGRPPKPEALASRSNAGREVQRWRGSGWTQIGYVESEALGGSATETQSYSFTSYSFTSYSFASYSFAATGLPVGTHWFGTHWFRLKQVDLSGQFDAHGSCDRGHSTVDIQPWTFRCRRPCVSRPQLQILRPVAQISRSPLVRRRGAGGNDHSAFRTIRLSDTLGQQVATVHRDTPHRV
jgi:hypothetical protein